MHKPPDAEHPTDLSSERLLLAAIAKGDLHAMASLIRLHSELVYSVAHRILQDPSSAEEVMQQVFLQIWRKPAAFSPGRGTIRGSLALGARNQAIDLLRQRNPNVPVDDLLLASSEDLLQSADRNLILDRLRTTIKGLPPQEARALDMAFFSGCTQAEIAATTQSPLATVKARVKGALNAIGKALGR